MATEYLGNINQNLWAFKSSDTSMNMKVKQIKIKNNRQ